MGEFPKGMKDGLPIAIGYLPIALTFGILSVQTGLTPLQATGMSIWVFAGASQFIAINLLQSHVLITEIILTTFILNLRHLLMSTSLSRKLQTGPFLSSLLSFGITDETFVVASVNQENTSISPSYFLGLALTAYSGWVFGTFIGSSFSELIPKDWATGMSIALYSMFIGLLVPSMKKSRKISFIAILGGLLSWGLTLVFPQLSNGWVIILSTIIAATIGSILPVEEVKSS
ncbi:AzlC family ABC transporter permease [Tepidibacillus fermentans]|uniref:4-azaleucine resistance transporter AzlC n=1 Tax=Tepidibacillus fermentans TaxID=1281767 RepID=A0A4R3KHH6_9BACI|nr:AzlC family ABC transporter permease [Tepidibacillus fermentans]TCS82583.1 4-azaleucine resistance transporter AzlC [Tepidibacillus fermentans]